MSTEPTYSCWIFVIKTNAYAGNFERPMCGFITGKTGDCEVGDEEAELFRKAHPGDDEFDDLVIDFPDEHGCYRPVTVLGYESKDVAIFLGTHPTVDQLVFMRDRARQFAEVTNPRDGKHKKITIRGFELIQCEIQRNENCVLRWKKGE